MAKKAPKKDHLFKKGTSGNPAGKPKGTVNKVTTEVKAALIEAFEKSGGVESLVAFAKANPDAFYKLWVKMLPTEVKAEVGLHPAVIAAINAGRKRVSG